MILRLAKHEDLAQCVEIGREFWEQTEYETPYYPEGVHGFCTGLIERGLMLVAEFESEIIGVAGILVSPFHFDPRLRVATEVFWYVRPGTRELGVGEAMLQAMEEIAKREGAVMFSMGTMYDPKADKMLEKRGYKLTERTYNKVL